MMEQTVCQLAQAAAQVVKRVRQCMPPALTHLSHGFCLMTTTSATHVSMSLRRCRLLRTLPRLAHRMLPTASPTSLLHRLQLQAATQLGLARQPCHRSDGRHGTTSPHHGVPHPVLALEQRTQPVLMLKHPGGQMLLRQHLGALTRMGPHQQAAASPTSLTGSGLECGLGAHTLLTHMLSPKLKKRLHLVLGQALLMGPPLQQGTPSTSL